MTDILIDIIEEIVRTAENYDIVERIVLRHVCRAFKVRPGLPSVSMNPINFDY